MVFYQSNRKVMNTKLNCTSSNTHVKFLRLSALKGGFLWKQDFSWCTVRSSWVVLMQGGVIIQLSWWPHEKEKFWYRGLIQKRLTGGSYDTVSQTATRGWEGLRRGLGTLRSAMTFWYIDLKCLNSSTMIW